VLPHVSAVVLCAAFAAAASGCGNHSAANPTAQPPTKDARAVIAVARRYAPQMEAATFKAVGKETAALNRCAIADRPELDVDRLEPLRLASLYKAIDPIYASLTLAVRRAHVSGPLRVAIERRARQLARFRHATVAPCRVLQAWAQQGLATDGPLYRAIGVPADSFPRSRGGSGDPTIKHAVDSVRRSAGSSIALQRIRLTLDPVLNSLR
jgi:hypothetical protein